VRRLIALVCLAAVLAAALIPLTSSLLWAALVPVCFFVVSVVALALVREVEGPVAQPLKFLAVLAPRAPPL